VPWGGWGKHPPPPDLNPLGGTNVLKHLKSSDDWSEKSLGAKGFTLIELLVVIVILGVLAAVVVFSVSGISNESETAGCAQELRTLETAIEAYRAQNPTYPASLNALAPDYIRDASDLLGSYTYTAATGGLTQGTCPN
jgi:general secretion pathway protein G